MVKVNIEWAVGGSSEATEEWRKRYAISLAGIEGTNSRAEAHQAHGLGRWCGCEGAVG